MRYQICYVKNQPLTTWKNTYEEAVILARKFQKAGYTVSVWEHTLNGSRMVKIDTEKGD